MSEGFTYRGLFTFRGKWRVLHLTWFAFFLTFVAWFNMAPLATIMKEDLGLSAIDIGILAIANVALTIPARVIVGQLLDKYGPRLCFSSLLIVMAIPTFAFALAQDFTQLFITRFILGGIGAGFVIGIRMVSEWFPPKEMGTAEGVYAGWGNFGSSAAAIILPLIALNLFGGVYGWRYAIALTGVICLIFGIIYYLSVTDCPPGKQYLRPEKTGAMEVSSWPALIGLILSNLPLVGALGLLAWRLMRAGMLTGTTFLWVTVILGLYFLQQAWKAWQVNAERLRRGVPEYDRYNFSQVVCLNSTYFTSFGAEMAVISMLPAWFEMTWGLDPRLAGLIASSFAFTNLFARPLGGFFSDKLGSRRKVILLTMLGFTVGFLAMTMLGPTTPLVIVLIVVFGAGVFVQAAEGATFAVVPLVKKRITGQIAGLGGAYGNVGAVVYLTFLSLASDQAFFLMIALTAASSLMICWLFLQEPKGSFAAEYVEHDSGSLRCRIGA